MRRLAASFLATIIAVAGGASGTVAQSTRDTGAAPVVVELFTSQGCVYCPPADALLQELAARPDVLPLALHVDYWDYIGWADAFAKPAFTHRQKAYARKAGRGMVYTPQMIIDGRIEVAGHKPGEVRSAIALRHERAARVRITVTARAEGGLQARLSPEDAKGAGAAQVVLVRFRPLAEVHIKRGENAGKTMRYANIVTRWEVIGQWDGTGTAVFPIPPAEEDPAQPGAVLVQAEGLGPILSAARLD